MELHEMFTEGCIGEFYGKDKFVRIYPLFLIDRVKFSFIRKGTGGEHLDIYMKMYPDFKHLMLDALGKRRNLYSDIQADDGSYPSARKYVSGDSGQNNLAIGKGQSGNPVIQGRSQEAGNYMIPFSFEELQETAYWFFKLYTYRPVPDEKVPFLNQAEKLCQRFWAFYYYKAQKYHPDTVPEGEALGSGLPEQEEKAGGSRQNSVPETAKEDAGNQGRGYQNDVPHSQTASAANPVSNEEKTAVIINGVLSDLKKLPSGRKIYLDTIYGSKSLSTQRKGKWIQILDGNGKYLSADRVKRILQEELRPEMAEELYRKYSDSERRQE